MSQQVIMWWVGLAAWVLLTISLRRSRRWLVYYLTAAFGFVLLGAFGAGLFDLDTIVEGTEASIVAGLASVFGIGVKVVNATGLAIPNSSGWAVFDIGLECSAVLEMTAILGLMVFYPAFRPGTRVLFGLAGLSLTFALNISRILMIVWIISVMGTGWVFAAHAVFGRLLFFAGTVALYWYLLTRPTISFTRERIRELHAQ